MLFCFQGFWFLIHILIEFDSYKAIISLLVNGTPQPGSDKTILLASAQFNAELVYSILKGVT